MDTGSRADHCCPPCPVGVRRKVSGDSKQVWPGRVLRDHIWLQPRSQERLLRDALCQMTVAFSQLQRYLSGGPAWSAYNARSRASSEPGGPVPLLRPVTVRSGQWLARLRRWAC